MNIDAARYNLALEKYEEIVEGMEQLCAFNDVSSTVDFEQFNPEMLTNYFNIGANLSLQVKDLAHSFEKELTSLKE